LFHAIGGKKGDERIKINPPEEQFLNDDKNFSNYDDNFDKDE
jgi:hypothetical protein